MNQLKLILRSMIQLTVLLVSLQWFCGCSLVFLGIGAAMDGGKADADTLLADVTKNLTAGDEVRISGKDSSHLRGTYLGPAQLDSVGLSVSASGRISRGESLLITANADTVQISVDDINYVERINSKNATAIGFGIGVIIDGLFKLDPTWPLEICCQQLIFLTCS